MKKDARDIAIFTVVEVIGLVIWLLLAGGGRTVGAYAGGRAYLAVGILAAFLIVEHVLAYKVIRGAPARIPHGPIPVLPIAIFSAIEAVIWSVWLVIAGLQPVVAAILLAALLVVEHTLSDNVAHGRRLLYRPADPDLILLSIIEAVAAAAWLAFVGRGQAAVGIGILAVGSFIEHSLLVRLGRRIVP